MEIVELDLLDGRGKIPVAVAGHIEAIRVRQFQKEMAGKQESVAVICHRLDMDAQGITSLQVYDFANELRALMRISDDDNNRA